MRLPVFTVPESWLLFIVQSTSDFTCLPLLNVWRRGYSFGFGMKNLQTQNGICLRRLRRILHFALVFLIPRPNIPSLPPHALWVSSKQNRW